MPRRPLEERRRSTGDTRTKSHPPSVSPSNRRSIRQDYYSNDDGGGGPSVSSPHFQILEQHGASFASTSPVINYGAPSPRHDSPTRRRRRQSYQFPIDNDQPSMAVTNSPRQTRPQHPHHPTSSSSPPDSTTSSSASLVWYPNNDNHPHKYHAWFQQQQQDHPSEQATESSRDVYVEYTTKGGRSWLMEQEEHYQQEQQQQRQQQEPQPHSKHTSFMAQPKRSRFHPTTTQRMEQRPEPQDRIIHDPVDQSSRSQEDPSTSSSHPWNNHNHNSNNNHNNNMASGISSEEEEEDDDEAFQSNNSAILWEHLLSLADGMPPETNNNNQKMTRAIRTRTRPTSPIPVSSPRRINHNHHNSTTTRMQTSPNSSGARNNRRRRRMEQPLSPLPPPTRPTMVSSSPHSISPPPPPTTALHSPRMHWDHPKSIPDHDNDKYQKDDGGTVTTIADGTTVATRTGNNVLRMQESTPRVVLLKPNPSLSSSSSQNDAHETQVPGAACWQTLCWDPTCLQDSNGECCCGWRPGNGRSRTIANTTNPGNTNLDGTRVSIEPTLANGPHNNNNNNKDNGMAADCRASAALTQENGVPMVVETTVQPPSVSSVLSPVLRRWHKTPPQSSIPTASPSPRHGAKSSWNQKKQTNSSNNKKRRESEPPPVVDHSGPWRSPDAAAVEQREPRHSDERPKSPRRRAKSLSPNRQRRRRRRQQILSWARKQYQNRRVHHLGETRHTPPAPATPPPPPLRTITVIEWRQPDDGTVVFHVDEDDQQNSKGRSVTRTDVQTPTNTDRQTHSTTGTEKSTQQKRFDSKPPIESAEQAGVKRASDGSLDHRTEFLRQRDQPVFDLSSSSKSAPAADLDSTSDLSLFLLKQQQKQKASLYSETNDTPTEQNTPTSSASIQPKVALVEQPPQSGGSTSGKGETMGSGENSSNDQQPRKEEKAPVAHEPLLAAEQQQGTTPNTNTKNDKEVEEGEIEIVFVEDDQFQHPTNFSYGDPRGIVFDWLPQPSPMGQEQEQEIISVISLEDENVQKEEIFSPVISLASSNHANNGTFGSSPRPKRVAKASRANATGRLSQSSPRPPRYEENSLKKHQPFQKKHDTDQQKRSEKEKTAAVYSFVVSPPIANEVARSPHIDRKADSPQTAQLDLPDLDHQKATMDIPREGTKKDVAHEKKEVIQSVAFEKATASPCYDKSIESPRTAVRPPRPESAKKARIMSPWKAKSLDQKGTGTVEQDVIIVDALCASETTQLAPPSSFVKTDKRSSIEDHQRQNPSIKRHDDRNKSKPHNRPMSPSHTSSPKRNSFETQNHSKTKQVDWVTRRQHLRDYATARRRESPEKSGPQYAEEEQFKAPSRGMEITVHHRKGDPQDVEIISLLSMEDCTTKLYPSMSKPVVPNVIALSDQQALVPYQKPTKTKNKKGRVPRPRVHVVDAEKEVKNILQRQQLERWLRKPPPTPKISSRVGSVSALIKVQKQKRNQQRPDPQDHGPLLSSHTKEGKRKDPDEGSESPKRRIGPDPSENAAALSPEKGPDPPGSILRESKWIENMQSTQLISGSRNHARYMVEESLNDDGRPLHILEIMARQAKNRSSSKPLFSSSLWASGMDSRYGASPRINQGDSSHFDLTVYEETARDDEKFLVSPRKTDPPLLSSVIEDENHSQVISSLSATFSRESDKENPERRNTSGFLALDDPGGIIAVRSKASPGRGHRQRSENMSIPHRTRSIPTSDDFPDEIAVKTHVHNQHVHGSHSNGNQLEARLSKRKLLPALEITDPKEHDSEGCEPPGSGSEANPVKDCGNDSLARHDLNNDQKGQTKQPPADVTTQEIEAVNDNWSENSVQLQGQLVEEGGSGLTSGDAGSKAVPSIDLSDLSSENKSMTKVAPSKTEIDTSDGDPVSKIDQVQREADLDQVEEKCSSSSKTDYRQLSLGPMENSGSLDPGDEIVEGHDLYLGCDTISVGGNVNAGMTASSPSYTRSAVGKKDAGAITISQPLVSSTAELNRENSLNFVIDDETNRQSLADIPAESRNTMSTDPDKCSEQMENKNPTCVSPSNVATQSVSSRHSQMSAPGNQSDPDFHHQNQLLDNASRTVDNIANLGQEAKTLTKTNETEKDPNLNDDEVSKNAPCRSRVVTDEDDNMLSSKNAATVPLALRMFDSKLFSSLVEESAENKDAGSDSRETLSTSEPTGSSGIQQLSNSTERSKIYLQHFDDPSDVYPETRDKGFEEKAYVYRKESGFNKRILPDGGTGRLENILIHVSDTSSNESGRSQCNFTKGISHPAGTSAHDQSENHQGKESSTEDEDAIPISMAASSTSQEALTEARQEIYDLLDSGSSCSSLSAILAPVATLAKAKTKRSRARSVDGDNKVLQVLPTKSLGSSSCESFSTNVKNAIADAKQVATDNDSRSTLTFKIPHGVYGDDADTALVASTDNDDLSRKKKVVTFSLEESAASEQADSVIEGILKSAEEALQVDSCLEQGDLTVEEDDGNQNETEQPAVFCDPKETTNTTDTAKMLLPVLRNGSPRSTPSDNVEITESETVDSIQDQLVLLAEIKVRSTSDSVSNSVEEQNPNNIESATPSTEDTKQPLNEGYGNETSADKTDSIFRTNRDTPSPRLQLLERAKKAMERPDGTGTVNSELVKLLSVDAEELDGQRDDEKDDAKEYNEKLEELIFDDGASFSELIPSVSLDSRSQIARIDRRIHSIMTQARHATGRIGSGSNDSQSTQQKVPMIESLLLERIHPSMVSSHTTHSRGSKGEPSATTPVNMTISFQQADQQICQSLSQCTLTHPLETMVSGASRQRSAEKPLDVQEHVETSNPDNKRRFEMARTPRRSNASTTIRQDGHWISSSPQSKFSTQGDIRESIDRDETRNGLVIQTTSTMSTVSTFPEELFTHFQASALSSPSMSHAESQDSRGHRPPVSPLERNRAPEFGHRKSWPVWDMTRNVPSELSRDMQQQQQKLQHAHSFSSAEQESVGDFHSLSNSTLPSTLHHLSAFRRPPVSPKKTTKAFSSPKGNQARPWQPLQTSSSPLSISSMPEPRIASRAMDSQVPKRTSSMVEEGGDTVCNQLL